MKIYKKRNYENHTLEIAFNKLSYKKSIATSPWWLAWVASLVRGPRPEI